MTLDRRALLSASLASAGVGSALLSGLGAPSAAAAPRGVIGQGGRKAEADRHVAAVLKPDTQDDQTAVLQGLIDRAAERGDDLVLPPGRYRTRELAVRSGTRIRGCGAATVLELTAGATLLNATSTDGVNLAHLTLDGGHLAPPQGGRAGLIAFKSSRDLALSHLDIRAAGGNGLLLDGCGGHVSHCRISYAAEAGIFALDSTGLTVTVNEVTDCGNNGILIWRSEPGEDGSQVIANRIARIAARGGGSGQNGNGINVFRAAGVAVTDNRITDCAYSAVRGNAASNLQIVANACARLGEVALYAEFGFEGALIASNTVDGAATGISVTNFDVGGRLAVIQGNLIRNLVRREHEPVDKRGEGIAVEADATISGNTIENAPTAGIVIGWGKHMRDCIASGNLIRNARVGIMVSADPDAGAAFVTSNMISGSTDGAIRAMTRGKPHGPDLAHGPATTGRVTISGNMAV